MPLPSNATCFRVGTGWKFGWRKHIQVRARLIQRVRGVTAWVGVALFPSDPTGLGRALEGTAGGDGAQLLITNFLHRREVTVERYELLYTFIITYNCLYRYIL
jgi:hypothetical protein